MAHAHAQSLFWEVKPVTPWTKKKLKKSVHLEMRNLKLTELRTEERKAEDKT